MTNKAELTDAEIERMLEDDAKWMWTDIRQQFANEFYDAPRWIDVEAQLDYVRKRVLGYCFLVYPYRTKEELAVEASLRGKHKKMADLIRPINGQPNPVIAQLAPGTWALMSELLSGERSLKTGRAKGETKNNAGRPKKAEKLRRGAVHQAAEIFLVLRDELPMIYPEQSQTDIRDRALLLAAMLKGIDDTDTIQNHLDQPKDERPPWRVYWYQEEDCGRHWWSPEPDLL